MFDCVLPYDTSCFCNKKNNKWDASVLIPKKKNFIDKFIYNSPAEEASTSCGFHKSDRGSWPSASIYT